MDKAVRFTSVQFRNFKALRDFSVSLSEFNVLVGPNNSGKSTIISAFRILSEGLQTARARSPIVVQGPEVESAGYRVPLTGLSVAGENIFTDYRDHERAWVRFRISNGNQLRLYFAEPNSCVLIPETARRPITSPSTFKTEYPCTVSFVPVLGPVEYDEPLYGKEAARRALLTREAARNFRNIWYHYPNQFGVFGSLSG